MDAGPGGIHQESGFFVHHNCFGFTGSCASHPLVFFREARSMNPANCFPSLGPKITPLSDSVAPDDHGPINTAINGRITIAWAACERPVIGGEVKPEQASTCPRTADFED
jgi:hypothetical protein